MNNILPPVKSGLQAMIHGFGDGNDAIAKQEAEAFLNELIPLFSQVGNFPKKMTDLHIIIRNHPIFSPLEEYIFDLLMLNFIGSDSTKLDPDYLDSPEWLKIEDDTAERGTELLNLLLYITEARDEGNETDLSDFLEEFLLTEDELYQDEFFIYEEVIKNQGLTDSSVNDIIKVGEGIESDELKDIFVPLFVYFNQVGSAEARYEALKLNQTNRQLNLALFSLVSAYEAAFGE